MYVYVYEGDEGSLLLGSETYTYTAKRYTFPYTRMGMEFDRGRLGEWGRVRVRVGVGVRESGNVYVYEGNEGQLEGAGDD